jgi:methylated-DNA-protein-cysteine methyltransferase-like protein
MGWDAVYRLVKQIPRGRVTTYGTLARALHLRGGARAIGYALAACPSGRGIPWHRVVGAGGWLRVPDSYVSLQCKLLASEGTRVVGRRVALDRYGWQPPRDRAGKARKAARKRPRRSGRDSRGGP